MPALMLPVILLGGIYSGVVTPTEAAAVAAAYALLLSCGVYRALGFRQVTELFVGASRSTAVVALVVAGALLVNYVVAAEQIPNEIGSWIQSLHVSRFGFLLIINCDVPGAGLLPRHAADAAGHRAHRHALDHAGSASTRCISG